MVKHFLSLQDYDKTALMALLDRALALKANPWQTSLQHKTLACIFEKPSTRTRFSFEVAMQQAGGQVITVSAQDLQLGRGEPVADTARVLSRYVDAIMLRALKHDTLLELAKHSQIPVINGLTDYNHPCQIMADLLTVRERFGRVEGLSIAWVGDGNNVCRSWLNASAILNLDLRLACPASLLPDNRPANIKVYDNAAAAVQGAQVVLTDTWISMGDADGDAKQAMLQPFQVNSDLMAQAAADAIFLHCLPATRGQEVTVDVIDGVQSAVWDAAENRLHAQKAILMHVLKND